MGNAKIGRINEGLGNISKQNTTHMVSEMVIEERVIGLLLTWGLVSTWTGLFRSHPGLQIARFFLGPAEEDFLGDTLVYLAMFYMRHRMLCRVTFF